MTQRRFRASDFTIVHDPLWLDERYGVTPGIRQLMEEALPEILAGKKQSISTMVKHCRRFPDVAPLKLYLMAAYISNTSIVKADFVGQMLYQEHPEFLPGRIALAFDAEVECQQDWCLELLGEEVELHLLYPERDTFHISEITGYYHFAFICHLFWQEFQRAEECLQLLEEVDPKCQYTLDCKREWSHHLLEQAGGNLMNLEGLDGLKYKMHERGVQTDQPPDFHHAEMLYLYEYDFRIDQNILGHILNLPRETLVKDLESIVEDSIRRYEYFRNRYVMDPDFDLRELCFPLHALFLLAHLESEESLPVVLRFIRQGFDFECFWMGCEGDKLLEDVIYPLGQHRLDDLQAYVRERPADSLNGRYAIVPALLKIVKYHPERRSDVIDWFEELFEWLLIQKIDGKWVNHRFATNTVIECKELADSRLKRYFQPLYDHSVIIKSVIQLSELEQPEHAGNSRWLFRKLPPAHKDIYSWYDNMLYEFDYLDEEAPEPNETFPSLLDFPCLERRVRHFLNWRGIGLEDDCPCGSGKEYRECCFSRIR